jgi:hypothetical protein
MRVPTVCVRPYARVKETLNVGGGGDGGSTVGRCRLTASKRLLKPHMVSALETMI